MRKFIPLKGERRPSISLRALPFTGTMTVCMAGVYRGGTSSIAAIVHGLGIYVGPVSDLRRDGSFEDITMRQPETETRVACIEQRNKEMNVWGWKNPGALVDIASLLPVLRDPRFIIVFRDSVAVMQARLRSNPRPFDEVWEILQKQTKQLYDFIDSCTDPLLLVSYERVLLDPELFVDDLIEFLDLPVSQEQRQEAISRIGPRGGYLHLPWPDK